MKGNFLNTFFERYASQYCEYYSKLLFVKATTYSLTNTYKLFGTGFISFTTGFISYRTGFISQKTGFIRILNRFYKH